jgi:hypothetical protein
MPLPANAQTSPFLARNWARKHLPFKIKLVENLARNMYQDFHCIIDEKFSIKVNKPQPHLDGGGILDA